jgi:AraC-like DNA-binding protein
MARTERTSYLDRLLASLEVHVRGFALCKVQRGYRLVLEPMDSVVIHYALKGPGILEVRGGPSLPFAEHDFFIVPRGLSQSMVIPDGPMTDVRGVETMSTLDDALLEMTAGQEADAATVCGILEAGFTRRLGLFDSLREPIVEHLSQDDPLRHAFQAVLAELAAPKLGTRALVEALLKQCLVLLVRRRLEGGGGGGTSLLLPAGDERLSSALAAMLERPADPHTLGGLARTAGMSRSAFALRFMITFGQPPMAFLRDLRLHHAARLLEGTELPIQAIADSVGYASRSYFTRAFRRRYGSDPRRFRASRR